MGRSITKKGEIKKLDKIWVDKVKERDDYICQVCQKKLTSKNSRAHHILPRQIKGMRWDTENGITLCDYHHRRGILSAHQNAIWFTYWLKTNKYKQYKHCINKLMEMKKL